MTKNEIIKLCNILYSAIEGAVVDYQGVTKEKAVVDLNNGVLLIADKLMEARKEIEALGHEPSNETTDIESGAPQQMELNYPRGGQLEYVIQTLRIRPVSPIWEAVNINDLGGDHFTLWIDKEKYQHGADTYQFLGKLRKVANDRGFKGWFGGDCLHIQL